MDEFLIAMNGHYQMPAFKNDVTRLNNFFFFPLQSIKTLVLGFRARSECIIFGARKIITIKRFWQVVLKTIIHFFCLAIKYKHVGSRQKKIN